MSSLTVYAERFIVLFRSLCMRTTKAILLFFLSVCSMVITGCGSLYSYVVETRYPPQGVFIQTEDYSFAERIDLHVTDCGSGSPLIYIHGNYGSILDILYSPLYETLCGHYRLIAFDRPGSGYSVRPSGLTLSLDQQVEAMVKLIEHYELDKVNLLAHSFGGAVALRFALLHPDKVDALYLLAPAVYPWPGDKEFFKDKVVQIPVFGTLLLETAFVPIAYAVSRASYKEAFNTDDLPTRYFRAARALAIRPETFRNTARDTSILWDELAEQSPSYDTITQQCAIAHGTADTSVAIRIHSAPLVRQMPNATLRRIENCGHHPHHTHPSEVLEMMGIHTSVNEE